MLVAIIAVIALFVTVAYALGSLPITPQAFGILSALAWLIVLIVALLPAVPYPWQHRSP